MFVVSIIAGIAAILAGALIIRYAGHPSVVMAKRMFMTGKFQRIIDTEARFMDLERSLEQATGIEEFWTRLRAGSTELGFSGVRMVIDGRVFEEFSTRRSVKQSQLRIPLAENRYVNFYCGFDSPDPLVLSVFANSIERGMSRWLAAQTPEALRMPVASEPRHFTTGAGASGA